MVVKEKMQIVKGDITKMSVDVIVNAANSTLLGGGGVDGAIHRAAGPELLAECQTLGGCATGQAKMTSAYALPAKYIIHTVGPVWRGGSKGEAKLLASCYYHTLKLATEKQAKTLAFPAISCGIYGYPSQQAAAIAIKETASYLSQNPHLQTIYFVCFDDTVYDAYHQVLDAFNHE